MEHAIRHFHYETVSKQEHITELEAQRTTMDKQLEDIKSRRGKPTTWKALSLYAKHVLMTWPTMQLCPQCEVLHGRTKCRKYENKGTCVSKNYIITWRDTHITEVAETSQYCIIFEQPRACSLLHLQRFCLICHSTLSRFDWFSTTALRKRCGSWFADMEQMTNSQICSNLFGIGQRRMEHIIRYFHYETPF